MEKTALCHYRRTKAIAEQFDGACVNDQIVVCLVVINVVCR